MSRCEGSARSFPDGAWVGEIQGSNRGLTQLYEAIDENELIRARLENRLAVLNIAVADLYELASDAVDELR